MIKLIKKLIILGLWIIGTARAFYCDGGKAGILRTPVNSYLTITIRWLGIDICIHERYTFKFMRSDKYAIKKRYSLDSTEYINWAKFPSYKWVYKLED